TVFSGRGVTVFASAWDLNNAARLVWDDASVSAYGLVRGMNLACEAGGLRVPGMGEGPPGSIPKEGGVPGRPYAPRLAPYGRVLLVDLRAARPAPAPRARLLANRDDCLWARALIGAPWPRGAGSTPTELSAVSTGQDGAPS
ncbi:MAG: hypothetical protein ACRD0D_01220, partial [Acidimicrobiales bacterium]